jgi:subtilisin-like proprotein convertase family protein
MMDGDGCSATCLIEADYQCTVDQVPNICFLSETDCGDGMDNDNDGMADAADSDCALAMGLPPCTAGEALYVLNSIDVPKNIPDEAVIFSRIAASHAGLVKRAVVKLSITHPFDADLDIALVSPFGTRIALSTDNGEDGSDYIDTVFDDSCMTSIYEGVAPFTGCYWPQDPLLMLTDEPSDGEWFLEVGDDALGDEGFVQSWSLALCVGPLP